VRTYLDHAASSPVRPEVAQQVAQDLASGLGGWANPSAQHTAGRRVGALLAQARVISRAITDLHEYLARKSSELGRAAALLRGTQLNNRQIAVIESFLRDPSGSVSAVDHQSTHRVSAQTAHNDLRGLEEAGFLARTKRGRRIVWFPAPDMEERVRSAR